MSRQDRLQRSGPLARETQRRPCLSTVGPCRGSLQGRHSKNSRSQCLFVLTDEKGVQRIYYLYFGSWNTRKHVHSAYLVVFYKGGPALEVRLSQARASGTGNATAIKHNLVFHGANYQDPQGMRRTPFRLVRRAGVPADGNAATF